MTVTRKAILENAPALSGTEIAILVSGEATDESDGFTFAISRLALSSSSTTFTIQWGDGSSEVLEETATNLTHTYQRTGLYRIRISDDVSSIRVSSGTDTIFATVYAPMVKEFRSNAQRMTSIPRISLRNATGLEFLDLRGSSVRSLGGSAFEGCSSLRSLDGCAEVEQLGMSTFAGCINLPARVDLPSIDYISASANSSPFENTNIKEFHFAAKNEETIRALQIFYDTNGTFGLEGAVSYFDL